MVIFQPSVEKISELLNEIPDPEVPAISIIELGVVRSLNWENNVLQIQITPTYSGCPAMFAIEDDIKNKLQENGIQHFNIKTIHFPAWTTDWLSDETKNKLKAYGISPPQNSSQLKHQRPDEVAVACPFCNSSQTTLTSWFGSTACKALYYCNGCQQPFEHFKCHH
jgi:ring-1,2-phenylacetyl-CoA epoxidase subunit PaaD